MAAKKYWQAGKELFWVLSAALFIFGGLELVWPRVVLAYFNLDWLLIVWVFTAIVLVIHYRPSYEK
ncbi:hypothetical protein D6821_02700 [Candidatus Parcubacteria bacterium]|nr:MAG: hypothetical protein D6821_02700 [Candidatus Parcubacteria bacterium]